MATSPRHYMLAASVADAELPVAWRGVKPDLADLHAAAR
jgi:hypothetical protein